jgi:hypothetical protein
VIYAGLCKALLFHHLEYVGSDLYSFLDMSRSWFSSGRVLWDNAYGDHTAIHNFYLLLAFSPLTIPFGAYGLIAALVLLNLAAAARVAFCPTLDVQGRVATVAALLSPSAFFVFDHPGWGFHPEICYPPLACLLSCELLDRRRWRALLAAALIVLVKEDGPVLCASVLLAFFVQRLSAIPPGSRAERRRIMRIAILSLLAVASIFVAGMALLHVRSRAQAGAVAFAGSAEVAMRAGPDGTAGVDVTASGRLADSLEVVRQTLARRGDPEWRVRLKTALVGYAYLVALVLLPLGRRFFRAVALVAVSAPPLVIVLTVSSALYGFGMMVWPPRVATLLALAITCVAFAASSRVSPPPGNGARTRTAAVVVGALVAASWGLQLPLLRRVGYSPWPRLRALALPGGGGYRASTFRAEEMRFLRCLGDRLPWGLPVTSVAFTHPVFHLQSIMFQGLERHALASPRVRIIPSSGVAPESDGALCRDPGVGGFAVQSDCSLLPVVSRCRRQAGSEP